MSNSPLAHAVDDLLPTSWDDVDRWLLAEARQLTRLRVEPETAAYVMHEGEVTLYVRSPPPCDHDAEQIGRALATFVHSMLPDQVLFTFPGVAVDRTGAPTTMLRAMAGTRDGEWRDTQVPLPFADPQAPIAATEVTIDDDWIAPVRQVFDNAPPPRPDVSKVRHVQDEFTVAVNPNSPGAAVVRRFTAGAGHS
jgi:hypothetical protein